jgi:hypothetical protein
MPDPMQYSTQAIICLDRDLLSAAKATQAKRRLAGDTTGMLNGQEVALSHLYMSGPVVSLPGEYRLANSRLIIIGHGNPQSTHISGSSASGTDFWWTPTQLARMVHYWLDGNVIKTVSIRSCYGGGDRGGKHRSPGEDLGKYLARMTVDPRKSFAYEFASRCANAQRVTARTGVVTSEYSYVLGADVDADDFGDSVVSMTQKVSGVRRGKAYKAVFTPDPHARPDNPKSPGVSMLNV